MAARQPKRARQWLNDGSCVRLRTKRVDQVRSYDFVHHRTHDRQAYRTFNVWDEFTRDSVAIRVRQRHSSTDAIEVVTDLFLLRGISALSRSDNGSEFVNEAVRQWIARVGARTAFIEPSSLWENGHIESLNAGLRSDFFGLEIFYKLREA